MLAKYQKLRNNGKLYGTIKRAMTLRAKRDAMAECNTKTLKQRFKQITRLIPIDLSQHYAFVDKCHKENPRKQNWTSPQAGEQTKLMTNDLGRYSGRCRYTHYTYTPMIQSYGRVLNGKLYYHFDGKLTIFNAPYGYRWENDNLGIKIVSITNKDVEYHPISSDLCCNTWCSVLRNKAKENYRRRKQKEREIRQIALSESEFCTKIKREAKQSNFCIRLTDSLNAGNCDTGTRAWMAQNGLSNKTFVLATELLKFVNDKRIKIVLLTGLKRHQQSLKEGFSYV